MAAAAARIPTTEIEAYEDDTRLHFDGDSDFPRFLDSVLQRTDQISQMKVENCEEIVRKLWSSILSLSIKRAPSSLLVFQRGIKSPQSSNPWEITLMVLFTLSQNWSFLRVIPCSRAPFSNLLDTMCRNVVLGYSKSGRGEACDWVTDQCFQAINVTEMRVTTISIRWHIQYNLGQNRWKIFPPFPPNQGWENGTVWLLRGFILDHDLGVMGVNQCWHFILSKIVGGRLFQAGRLFNFSPVSASS